MVNSLLTQLDGLKHRRNVLVLATSNLTESIDCAFMDRADICMYIGNPSVGAIYHILLGCIYELIRVGIIADGHQETRTKVTTTATFSNDEDEKPDLMMVTR